MTHLATELDRRDVEGWEIVVADDGSSDRTAAVVSDLAADEPRIRVESREVNRGKGDALARGFGSARGDVVVFLDADLPVSVDDLASMIGVLEDHDVVAGSRRIAGARFAVPQPRLRRWGGAAFLGVVRALGYRVGTDPQCGVKVLRRDPMVSVMSQVVSPGFGFDIELLTRAADAGYRVAEYPVVWTHTEGSRVRPLHDAWGTVTELVRLRRAMRVGTGPPASPGESRP